MVNLDDWILALRFVTALLPGLQFFNRVYQLVKGLELFKLFFWDSYFQRVRPL